MERVFQMTEWLKNNIWPPSQIEQYMKETAIHRAKRIRDNGTKAVMEIAREYPRLLETLDIISQDFSILNPDWVPVFKDKILLFATREKQAVHLLSNLETISANHQSDIVLLVLPIILLSSIYKIGRKMFRPTFIGTQKAFIDIQPIGSQMAEYLRSKGTIEFPYVLMLGDNECLQAFVILNGEALEQKNIAGSSRCLL